jgi:DNA-binding transcriptional MerR regulator
MFSIQDLSRKIDVPFYRIVYAHQTGRIPEPARWKNQRVYDDGDVERAREYFRSRADKAERNRGSEGTQP